MTTDSTSSNNHGLTPSQTVGPYLHIGLDWLNVSELAAPDVAGKRLSIRGQLLDADGLPVPDGLIEIWQANSYGKYAHPADTRDLPLEADLPTVQKADADEQPIISLSIISDRMDRLEMTDYANRVLVNRFSAVDGVASARVWGARRYSMRKIGRAHV